MTDREARIAKNEAISRDINEGIEEALASLSPEGYARMLCECGDRECERLIAISVVEYEAARSDSRRFVVVKDHVVPDVELVVVETERYVVVQKREGTPAEVARETDPRD
ncbi:MAG TPA: hypothetical protein VFZ75_02075 [Actinomycetota bacterium]|nr:hypothetical protein [Actinomycetota bacterium]